MPGGNPIGLQGSQSSIREIQGGVDDALRLFDSLTQGGTVKNNPGYPGLQIIRPDGGYVSIRTEATRSPNTIATIDINIPGIPIRKIKFNP
ncbi:hypothetical protein [Leptolyngbya sp. 7M]|uniref:hypothetical protein n=1 Tax=Leptolyngbya sp. 7M TaxID=2812896 RepID=UPI001B8C8AF4|nr:hypothetical protein [Leptolyngbya sp. 7M]QYO67761.1 hypothetical protein JVX88_13810 [Leptolyngbya sp. 7M]